MRKHKDTELAANLEGLVVISGPCSALPDRCTRRRQTPATSYRPLVEAHDTAERLYTKNRLPLFEILDYKCGPDEADSSEGPAATVLRRRRQSSRPLVVNSDESPEDLSSVHYQRLHRKPEYLEKRVRNREMELYQYARWRETQQRRVSVVVGANPDAHRMQKLEIDKEEDKSDRKRVRVALSNELRGLVDSPGFARAQEKAADGSTVSPLENSCNGLDANDVLTPAERRAAHLGGLVLEQLLVQAARLPVCGESMADTESETEDDGSEPDTSDVCSGASASDSEPPSSSSSSGCCCPREFALPPRLYAHLMKQRERD
ncbi:hypothetical protein J3B02_002637 [Coemansia erecta]|uniref:Uncharacterized protein n=1 Tax=Coemansia asiatica TaxID=1052880 RepID=A0A9W7XF08_9FUNG|nr:hypothetical protein LPJ64_005111 [Coemansia asiatica]KAJ2854513.1 hypothetical protein J3B02_002637 [Coemansia erecta]KAJ2856437.1 hypothetical protein FB639_006108 [Coemansia asiatica]